MAAAGAAAAVAVAAAVVARLPRSWSTPLQCLEWLWLPEVRFGGGTSCPAAATALIA